VNDWTGVLCQRISERSIFVQRFRTGIDIARLWWLAIRNARFKNPGRSISFGSEDAFSSIKLPRLAII
jgi:hypothetical protein